MASEMNVAAVQLQCSADTSDNFARATAAVQSAAHEGAGLVVLPELFASLGRTSAMRDAAEPLDGQTLAWTQQTAVQNHCAIVAGSFVERDPNDAQRLYNTSIAVGSDGSLLGSYRKIHMFDVDVEGAFPKSPTPFAPEPLRPLLT